MLRHLFFIAICAASVIAEEEVSLPPSLKTCKKDLGDYSSCLRLAIQESWPVIVKGIKELNIPPLDPFITEYVKNRFDFGEVTGTIVVRNAKTYGLSKARFLSVKPQHQDNHFSIEVDLEVPKIFMEGDFKSNGKLGSFAMGAKGQFNISMDSVREIVAISGPVVNDRWMIEELSVTPEVGNMKIWASDLFNGNEELTKAMLVFANENWQLLYQGMLPYVSKNWNDEIKKLVSGVFAKIPFSKAFP